ncbi:MAG: glycosyltransferase family 2 protein [bacterium]
MISVIIPCRNEQNYIAQCLDSIVSQNFPKENLEVLLVDGNSQDKTKEIVQDYIQKYPFLRLLENPRKFAAFGLNIGIKKASGEIIVRMDAHAAYQKDYVSKCVKYLKEYEKADNVGGAIKTLPAENTLAAKAIAIILSGRLGAASSFRLGSDKVMEVDTVFGGCFRKKIFDKIGFFDERMARAQDIEFNKRLIRSGGKIILAPDILAVYYPESTLLGFWKHNFQDGFWVIYPLKFGVRYFSLRHLLPLALTGAVLFSLFLSLFLFLGKVLFVLAFGPYLFFVSLLCLQISFKRKEGLKIFPYLILAVFCRHFGYGIGSLFGMIKILKEKLHEVGHHAKPYTK